MDSAKARMYVGLIREFAIIAQNMTREAMGRKQDAVHASRARMASSRDTLRQARAMLDRHRRRMGRDTVLSEASDATPSGTNGVASSVSEVVGL